MGRLRRCRSFRSGLLGFSTRNSKSSTISTSIRRRISSSDSRHLRKFIEQAKEKGTRDGVFPSETEFSEEMMEIGQDFVAIHGEMVLLKNYSSLNFAGLIKILKKYDKRTGELLSLPFTQLSAHQPFFTTNPLTRLVQECEENLKVPFPLETEVIESSAIAQEQMPDDILKPHLETTLPLVEEMVDISRSISAARRALQGLKKEQHYRDSKRRALPIILSLSYLFGNQDLDIMGAVTAENSPCESLVTLHDGEDENKDIGSPN